MDSLTDFFGSFLLLPQRLQRGSALVRRRLSLLLTLYDFTSQNFGFSQTTSKHLLSRQPSDTRVRGFFNLRFIWLCGFIYMVCCVALFTWWFVG